MAQTMPVPPLPLFGRAVAQSASSPGRAVSVSRDRERASVGVGSARRPASASANAPPAPGEPPKGPSLSLSQPPLVRTTTVAMPLTTDEFLNDPSLLNPSRLAQAYLSARRKTPMGSAVRVPVVRDNSSVAVDYGMPCDWTPGTAERVLAGDLTVEYIEYDNPVLRSIVSLISPAMSAAGYNGNPSLTPMLGPALNSARLSAFAMTPQLHALHMTPSLSSSSPMLSVGARTQVPSPHFDMGGSHRPIGARFPFAAPGSTPVLSARASHSVHLFSSSPSPAQPAPSLQPSPTNLAADEASFSFAPPQTQAQAQGPLAWSSSMESLVSDNGDAVSIASRNSEAGSATGLPLLAVLGPERIDYFDKDTRFMEGLCMAGAATQGERSKMEDAHTLVNHFEHTVQRLAASLPPRSAPSGPGPSAEYSSAPQAFAGVYDGHGGAEAAVYCRDHLHLNIAKELAAGASLEDAVKKGTLRTEAEFMSGASPHKVHAGSVMVCAVFWGRQLCVANLGDCRAVLCRGGEALTLTVDHTPKVFSECSRVERAGGVIKFGYLNEDLAVTRAIGDIDPSTGSKIVGLSADPEVHTVFVQDEDEFLLLACDGLWDVLSSEKAVTFARQSLQKYNDVDKTADDLVKEALRLASSDNITVAVIGFQKVDPEMAGALGVEIGKIVVPPSHSRLPGHQPHAHLQYGFNVGTASMSTPLTSRRRSLGLVSGAGSPAFQGSPRVVLPGEPEAPSLSQPQAQAHPPALKLSPSDTSGTPRLIVTRTLQGGTPSDGAGPGASVGIGSMGVGSVRMVPLDSESFRTDDRTFAVSASSSSAGPPSSSSQPPAQAPAATPAFAPLPPPTAGAWRPKRSLAPSGLNSLLSALQQANEPDKPTANGAPPPPE